MKIVDPVSISNVSDINDIFGFQPIVYHILGAYNTLGVLFSILGNGVVLYGTTKYNAIDIDGLSVIFIQNVAVADLLLTFSHWIPLLITNYTRRWIFGEVMCFVFGVIPYFPLMAEPLLIATISLYRLYILVNPLYIRYTHLSRSLIRNICTGLWFLALCGVTTWLLIGCKVYFEPRILTCRLSTFVKHEFKIFIFSNIVIFTTIPIVAIVTPNIAILCEVAASNAKHRGKARLSSRALKTVSYICWLFIISMTVTTVRLTLMALGISVPLWLFVLQAETYYLNVVANPIIYTITNARFKEFMKRMLLRREQVIRRGFQSEQTSRHSEISPDKSRSTSDAM